MNAYEQNPFGSLPLFDEPAESFAELIDRRQPHFNGPEYSREQDDARLTGQILRVHGLMIDGEWRTLQEIADATGDPHASISAQLRHLRKARFGSFVVDKRHRGEPANGLYEYRVSK